MTVSYSDFQKQAGSRPLWRMRITTLSPARSFNFSDVTHKTVDASVINEWLGNVAAWDTIYSGISSLSANQFTQSEVRVRLMNVRTVGATTDYGDSQYNQPLGDTLSDLLNSHIIIGGRVRIWQSWGEYDLVDITSTNIQSLRFDGVIYDVPLISRDFVEIRAIADDLSGILPVKVAAEGAYPNVADDISEPIPLVIGRVGFRFQDLFWDKNNDGGGSFTTTAMSLLNISQGATRAVMVDRTNLRVACSSSTIEKDSAVDGGRLMVTFDQDSDLVCSFGELTTGDYNEAGGYIDLPQEASGPGYVDVGDVIVRRMFPCTGDPSQVASGTTSWTNWENAFDNDPATYANIFESASKIGGNDEGYVWKEPGVVTGTLWQPNDGATPCVVALVQPYLGTTSGSSTNVTVSISPGDSYTSTPHVLPVAAGKTAGSWQTIYHYLTEAEFNATINGDMGDTEGARAWISDGTLTNKGLRVAMIGYNYEMQLEPRVLFAQTDGLDPSSGREVHNKRGPKFWYQGYGGSGITVYNKGTGPSQVLQRFLLDVVGATAAEINTGASTFGSLELMEDNMDASMQALTSQSTYRWDMAIYEDSESATGADIISRFSEATFCNIWRSVVTNKWCARMKARGSLITAQSKILYSRNIVDGSLESSYSPLTDVYNAVYVEFNYDQRTGKYLDAVYIDNSTLGSSGWDGNSNSTYESAADTSQAAYGRRVKIIRSKYLRDRASAWDTCYRTFLTLYLPKIRIKFDADFWAADLEPCYVFVTDSTIDDIMRYPGYIASGSQIHPSWIDRKWWVTSISETPYQPFTVEAINVD